LERGRGKRPIIVSLFANALHPTPLKNPGKPGAFPMRASAQCGTIFGGSLAFHETFRSRQNGKGAQADMADQNRRTHCGWVADYFSPSADGKRQRHSKTFPTRKRSPTPRARRSSTCDLGKAEKAVDLNPRARQNVVFELGFFIGKIGPERVAALVKGNIELPSDFDGVVYISLDKEDWKTKLGTELKFAGYTIDWNKVHE
jgi:Predicted nucleotide-binding protein containing TIR-like domain